MTTVLHLVESLHKIQLVREKSLYGGVRHTDIHDQKLFADALPVSED
jgi:hypothetical protein